MNRLILDSFSSRGDGDGRAVVLFVLYFRIIFYVVDGQTA